MTTPRRIDLVWRKSSRSDNNGGACVEVAGLTDGVAVRDSKDPSSPVLTFTPYAWTNFTTKLATFAADLRPLGKR